MRASPSTGFHTIAVVAGLAAVTGILAFLVLRPSWLRGALSASSSRQRLRSPRNQRTPLRFRGCEERAIADARVEVAGAAVAVVGVPRELRLTAPSDGAVAIVVAVGKAIIIGLAGNKRFSRPQVDAAGTSKSLSA